MGAMGMVIRLLGYMEVMAIEAGTVTMAAIEVVMAVAIMAAGMAAFAAVVDENIKSASPAIGYFYPTKFFQLYYTGKPDAI
jgi:hypothetical protein